MSTVHVQYHSTDRFSVFNVDAVADTREVILDQAEILVNPENNDELIIRTEDQQIKLPFLVDGQGNVNFFDLEGQPLGYHVPSVATAGGDGDVMSKADFVKSPMPGTVVKCYVKVG